MNTEDEGRDTEKEIKRQQLTKVYLEKIQSTNPRILAQQLADEEIAREDEKTKSEGQIEELKKLVIIDDLVTTVFNHGHFLNLLENEKEATRRMPKPSSYLLAIDLDNFKITNDQLGHATADELLKNTGVALVQSVRDVDAVGRTGGDEFSVIIRRANEEIAIQVAQRIQKTAPEIINAGVNKPGFNQTISIGLALITEDMDTEKIRDIADAGMYTSKGNGKAQIGLGMVNPDTGSIETSLVPLEKAE